MTLYPVPTCGGFSHTNKQFSDTSWYPTIPLNSDSIYLERASDSTGSGFSPTRHKTPAHPPADTICKSCPTGYRSEVPTTPSLGYINFLKHLTELREIFHLLGYQFIIKGYNSGIARWKRCRGQGMGKGWSACMVSSLRKLQGFRYSEPECGQRPNRYFL